MLIYDSFDSVAQAQRFADWVRETTGRETTVFESADEAQDADPIPVALVPPVVHVERRDDDGIDDDQDLANTCAEYGGVFVGT